MTKFIFSLLRYRIVKIVGAGVVLYFGLMGHKENPDSLGYRLSKDNVSKHINEIKERSTYIATTIRDVKGVEAGALPVETLKNRASNKLIIHNNQHAEARDEVVGTGENIVKCGDQAKISYSIYIKENNVELEKEEGRVIIIGSKKNKLLEEKIMGMKEGGVRIIEIPRNFQAFDPKLAALLKFNETELFYRIKLLQFAKSLENITCEEIKK